MVNTILIIVGILVVIFVIALIYSSCVLAGKSDRFMEEYQTDILCENKGGLTELENATLERLLQLYEEDGVSFVLNDGRVVDYETE